MRPLLVALVTVSVLFASEDVTTQPGRARSHAIYITAIEFKGSPMSDKATPPQVDSGSLSRRVQCVLPGAKGWQVSAPM